MDASETAQYLRPTPAIDWDNPEVARFARSFSSDSAGPRENAVSLYLAVRDSIRYDPYTLDLTIDGMKASATLRAGRGWCVTKAILLAACCRCVGIPARLGYADIRNHLSTERMRQAMKTDIFYWHGYTSIFLEGTWLKATPAFNRELCEKFRIRVLDFDGLSDSIYHPFDLDGNQHMEYLRYRGEYADLPLGEMIETFLDKYPVPADLEVGDFDADVDKEVSTGKKG